MKNKRLVNCTTNLAFSLVLSVVDHIFTNTNVRENAVSLLLLSLSSPSSSAAVFGKIKPDSCGLNEKEDTCNFFNS